MKYWVWLGVYCVVLLTVSLLVVTNVIRWTSTDEYLEMGFILVWVATTIVLTVKGKLKLGR
jgi:hypothetical protein